MPKKAVARVTMETLAEQVGVSVSVVSRVISGQAAKYRISPATEQAILRAARKRQFTPNLLARGLRLKETRTLGLVIPDISNAFFAAIARSVAVAARRAGLSVILCDSEDDVATESQVLTLLQNRMVDGLLISPAGARHAHLEALQNGPLPIVLMDRLLEGSALPSVTSDNFGGARSAVAYLIEQGHRCIGYLQGTPQTWPSKERLRGWRTALTEAGCPAPKSLAVGTAYTEESGFAATQELLQRRPRPTALLAASNKNAFGALRAVAQAGLAVPRDVSLIAFDDLPSLAYVAPPLTAVAQDTATIGQQAVDLLLECVASPRTRSPRTVIVPTNLVVRQSVRSLAT